jgi:GntR family transcriptional repressor for pyruvate dehydrogenase complex
LLSDQVALSIEQYVVSHGLQPGDRLPAGRTLAEMYGVSRTVIRDALAILVQRGLIETRPGSGVFVRDGGSNAVGNVLLQMLRLNAVTFREVVEARRVIETHNAEQAAIAATERDLERMAAAIDAMVASTDPRSYVDADFTFHEAIAEAAGNRMLIALLQSVRPLVQQGMLIPMWLSDAEQTNIDAHREIHEAIKNRDPERARQGMNQHLVHSARELAVATEHNTVARRSAK